jgi:alkanesulfonate monooxygenase SsuD/methylene tetrahydromethanopterin reductase-like flavin-dependent oxidoreductase (luciferase family)
MEFGVFDLVERNGQPLAELYEDRLRLCEVYDQRGFYCYHVAEHHGTPHGLASSPSVFLSAVAQRTTRLRIGALVYLMPFYHPLRLIEELCILDQLSGGRLEIGLGRGISPAERGFYGIPSETAEQQALEGYDVVMRGLEAPELTFHGSHYTFENVPMELAPFQKPRPPIWYGLHAPESAAWAATRDFQMVSAAPTELAIAAATKYAQTRRDLDRHDNRIGVLRKIVVAQTDSDARRTAREAYPRFLSNFNHLFTRLGVSPKNGQRPPDFDAASLEGTGIAGSPKTVAETIRHQLEGSHFNYFICEFVFGDISIPDAQRSIELFATEVMPALQVVPLVKRKG